MTFEAAWAGPSFNYLSQGHLNEIHNTYGPDGTNDYIVISVEADSQTTIEDLQGIGENTAGDYLGTADFPFVNENGWDIGELYEINYFPTIFGICPDGILQELNQLDADEILAVQEESCCPNGNGNDLRILSEINFEADCGTSALTCTLQNAGEVDQTSCTIQVIQNDVVLTDYTWTGLLTTCELEEITFDDLSLETGIVTLSILESDDDNLDNTRQLEVTGVAQKGGSHVKLEILTDDYPDEVTWQIMDDQGNFIVGDGPLSEMQTLHEYDLYLPEIACYTITVADQYGDGLNGEVWGGSNGSISMVFVNDDGTDGASIIDYDGLSPYEFLTAHIQVDEISPINAAGVVFSDDNENGIQDDDEPGIPGILVDLDGVSTCTNEDGIYVFENIEDPGTLVVHIDPEIWPTTATNSTFDLSDAANFNNDVGVSANDPNYGADINYAQSGVYICEQENLIYLSVTNTGNSVVDFEVTFDMDELFEILSATPQAEQILENSVKWLTEDVSAGSTVYYHVDVMAPDWQSMGDLLVNTITL